MNIDRLVLAVAGVMVMATALLAHFHSPNWLWFTGFIGLNLLQSAFTGLCPMATILKKMGTRQGAAF